MNKIVLLAWMMLVGLVLWREDNRLTRMENMMDAAIAGAVRE